MSEIKNLKPEIVWRNFDALTQVPRPSGHREKAQQFLLDFAKRVGVEAFQDPAGNIVMRKPATPGMEDRKTVILQAHFDMVPQKAPESTHNFETDPIKTWVDGDWVRADKTTLGADDGIGIAAIMAVMESTDIKHGPIEALCTADEETGMFGANELPAGELQGEILLNLDTEEEGEMIIGSAGGIDVTAEIEYKEETADPSMAAVHISLQGFKGGHSGLEIGLGRANANKLMARILHDAIAECDAQIATWQGGNMRNAIPFKADSVVVVAKEDVEELKNIVADYKGIFEEEFKGIEDRVDLTATETEMPATVMPADIQDNVVDAIYACHNGVMRYIPSIPGIVETSSNLAIVTIGQGKASVKILARSASDTMRAYIAETLSSCFSMAGMKVTTGGEYGGWNPDTDSQIVKTMEKVYKDLFGKDPVIQVVHAGLECSIILSKYPGLDICSFGPTLRSPHTANERCLIPTVDMFWQFLVKTLEAIPAK